MPLDLKLLFENLPAHFDHRYLHHMRGYLQDFLWGYVYEHGHLPLQVTMETQRDFIVKHLSENM